MKKLFTLILFIIAPMTWAQETTIPANDSMIQYSGRVDFSTPQAPRFDWGGVAITVGFKASSITFLLDDMGNNFDVQLDGKPVTVWVTSRNQSAYTLADVTPGNHVLKVVKRTEALFGLSTFKGIQLSKGGNLVSPPDTPNRRIEIIGDSYACGYGVESDSAQCSSLRPYENADKAFGALIARDLQAEYHLEAFSGKGVIRNWGEKLPKSADPYPPLFDRTLCQDEKSVWDFNKWTPNAIIIHLGFNDFSTEPSADPKEFSHAYIDFIKHIREKYPKAFIFCAAPLDQFSLSALVDKIVEKRNSAGDQNVMLLTYPPVTPDNFGCDGHPNVVAQRKIADAMVPLIKETLFW